LAVALGLLVWWGVPCREALEAGDLHLLLAGLAAVTQVGLLVRFDGVPGFCCWVGILATGCVGWFAQPFLFALILPLVLLYYLSVGTRHQLVWHLALLAGQAAPLAANAFWLTDLVKYWWIRLPLPNPAEALPHGTLDSLWTAPLWGCPADRSLAVALLALAGPGVWILNYNRARPAARMLGLGGFGALGLAVTGVGWEPLEHSGAGQLLVSALWFAILPAVHALAEILPRAARWVGSPRRGAALGFALLLPAGVYEHRFLADLAGRWTGTTPLVIGLGPERTALVEALRKHTSREARILWEDLPGGRDAPHWTPLLPLLTGRAYLGGLEPDACIEHAYAGLVDQSLAGRPVADWGDAELEDFCRRYNIGWAVCWSPGAVTRFGHWKGAKATAPVADQGAGALFTLQPRSYFLKGQGRLLSADCQRIALADIIPEDGKVVLSMHYQSGLVASPGRVQVEREPDPYDRIDLIRLRVPGPVARVTLRWEKRRGSEE
jgi:hypothetical protein